MKPAIFGIAGHALSQEERALFRAFPPLGFILFKRNIDTPEQVKALTISLRELTGRNDTPILIDQEGGRVQRLRPPHWVDLPELRSLGELYQRDAEQGIKAVKLQTRIIAGMLRELGINVVCAPVLDVPVPGAHDVIGRRAFAADTETVAALGAVMAQEFLDCGVMPVIKHIPGHGRAESDSHYDCPVVATEMATLAKTDFQPFKAVAQEIGAKNLWAMTAHVVFTALDEQPVSVSKKAIDFIRSDLGVDSFIIPDAIEMEALGGTLLSRALATLQAGCDATLHCSGKFADVKAVIEALPDMTQASLQRFTSSMTALQGGQNYNWRDGVKNLEAILNIQQAATYQAHEALTQA